MSVRRELKHGLLNGVKNVEDFEKKKTKYLEAATL